MKLLILRLQVELKSLKEINQQWFSLISTRVSIAMWPSDEWNGTVEEPGYLNWMKIFLGLLKILNIEIDNRQICKFISKFYHKFIWINRLYSSIQYQKIYHSWNIIIFSKLVILMCIIPNKNMPLVTKTLKMTRNSFS